MNLRSRAITVDILGSVEKVAGDVVLLIFKYVALFVALASLPVAFTVLPLWMFLRNDYGGLSSVAYIGYWLIPFSCAFYMFMLAHWSSVHYWRKRYGSTKGWREEHGGIVGTTLKRFFFLFLGLAGSFPSEILYVWAAAHVVPDRPTWEWAFVYALLPAAGFAPVILLCLWRWFRNRELRRSLTPQPSTLPEQIAKTVGAGRIGEMDHKQIIGTAKRGLVEAALMGRALEDHLKDLAAGYRQAARQMAEEEEREKLEAEMKRKREANLLNSIDAQIARIVGETFNN
jgi:hypothetical protein